MVDTEDPVGAYLRAQARLQTPVTRMPSPARTATAAARHRELIPLTGPGPGEQYAFEVDLGACTGCKSCVAACHALNGLDDDESWRVVRGGRGEQPVTESCHHCADPACLHGCPVLAYEKDGVTGIVRHLDDQCIGCQYCLWTCPYEAPKYNARLGIVRKCDLCSQRLGAGEAPACVQACPTEAIRVVKAPTGLMPAAPGNAAAAQGRAGRRAGFFAGLPDPAITGATTRYRPARWAVRLPTAGPIQGPAHTPLAVLLVLMQGSLGILVGGGGSTRCLWWATAAMAAGLAIGLGHLGRPERAWRVWLNLRTSWFSREAVLFGAYAAACASAAAGAAWARAGALAFGAAGLVASVCLYAVTRRPFWSAPRTSARFVGTAALAAGACEWARGAWPPAAVLALLLLKLAAEAEPLLTAGGMEAASRRLRSRESGGTPLPPASASLRDSARLLRGAMHGEAGWRLALAAAAAALLWVPDPFRWLALPLLAAGEIAERRLFFRCSRPPDP